jgi:MYXO-CTERM domain-containing protein
MNFSLIAVAAIGLAALGAAASASAQVEFAVFNPAPSSTGGVVNFTEDTLGHLNSVSSATPTLFMFDLTPLSAFGNLRSTFDFSARETAAASSGVIGGVSYVTAPYSGTFDYFYSGPTTTKGGITLTTGELLLRGTFTNAAFTARAAASGGGLADDGILGTVSYSSALPSSILPLGGNESFSLAFIDITPVLGLQNGFIRHFTAVGDGQFSSGGAVPEPSPWAFMLAGVGALGGVLRRRAVASSAA